MQFRPKDINSDLFWLNRDGRGLTPNRVEKIVRYHAAKAGLGRCYPHMLRHTSSVMYLRNGGDVFSLQRKLGHSSLAMTRRYSNLTDIDIRSQHLVK
jgi:site-specific recombinase XerD